MVMMCIWDDSGTTWWYCNRQSIVKVGLGWQTVLFRACTLSLATKGLPSRTAKSTISRMKVVTPSGSLVTLPEGAVVTLE